MPLATGKASFGRANGSQKSTEAASAVVDPATKPQADLLFEVPDVRITGLVILTLLAMIYSLYFGREILLPIVIAAVLNLLLQPLMRFLTKLLPVPMALAALIAIALVFAVVAGIGLIIAMASPGWTERAPESFALLKQKLAFLSAPLTYVQNLLGLIENMGAASGSPAKAAPGNALPVILLFGTASTVGSLATTIIMLYFMLASGDRLFRALIEVLPRFGDKRRAVEIMAEIQVNITRYLLTVTLMNAGVGIVTGLAMWACGLADPVLWGAVAFLLNFVPIIGPLLGVGIFFIVGLIALPWPFPALAPVLAYGLIHVVEGEGLTPMLLARRFELNPVLVILSLFFWHFIWGIPGALLAVPLLAICKIFADRIEPLKGLGHLIGA